MPKNVLASFVSNEHCARFFHFFHEVSLRKSFCMMVWEGRIWGDSGGSFAIFFIGRHCWRLQIRHDGSYVEFSVVALSPKSTFVFDRKSTQECIFWITIPPESGTSSATLTACSMCKLEIFLPTRRQPDGANHLSVLVCIQRQRPSTLFLQCIFTIHIATHLQISDRSKLNSYNGTSLWTLLPIFGDATRQDLRANRVFRVIKTVCLDLPLQHGQVWKAYIRATENKRFACLISWTMVYFKRVKRRYTSRKPK